MAQLVVRNLPEELKSKLKSRAKRNGRSLEAEVREILLQAALKGDRATTGIGTALARKLARHKVSDAAWEEFNSNLAEVRKSWRIREPEFGE
jgi:plasmid stability protein